ncbi:MAG: sodium:alanine symporter family protein, partial [Bdellovibrionales bacterium]|nr:sodium:alanine symporter family protein [Bdellovibrionales bacterium]
METINHLLEVVVGYVWNIPLVILLIGSGILFSSLLGLIQVKGFMHAIQVIRGKFDHAGDPGDISHFQALTTALSATVGLGNIAGVAVAIKAGGPGATFWMIVAGLVGMATKYAECSLSVMYRRVDENGHVHGGPMHYIVRGLGEKWRPLAVFFAFACIASSFGASNMFQTNNVAAILNTYFDIPVFATGVALSVAVGLVILGGIKRIGMVTSFLVPFMGIGYVVGSLVVICMHLDHLPGLFAQIFNDAFTGTAAAGGFAGVAVKEVLVQGVRRACFSNEAGLGSAPIAHAAAAT